MVYAYGIGSDAHPLATFGLNLRHYRMQRLLTQERLASAAGITTSEVSRIERAEREPRLTTIARLARALDISPGDLFEDVEANAPDGFDARFTDRPGGEA